MNEIKVSVILPVYNVKKYLHQCMDSILGQTLKEIEIICVDDGSTDGSTEILKEYEKKDSRVRAFYRENRGAGAARNYGMAQAKGKYFSFLDSDDFFEPDMLELAYEKAEEYETDIVLFRADEYLTEEKHFQETPWTLLMPELPHYEPFNRRHMTENIFKVVVGWAWDKLFSREFVEKHHLTFQEQRTSNDLLFVFSAIVLAEKMGVVDKVLVHQRCEVRDSLSSTREKSWDCFYKALTALRSRIREEGLWWELEKDFINYALHFSLWNLNTLAEPTHTMLRDKLVNEWFDDFEITGKSREYFYNKREFDQYKEIIATADWK